MSTFDAEGNIRGWRVVPASRISFEGTVRIAFLHPWQNSAENQGFQSLRIAASRIGHELLHCANSDDVNAAAPDFVLAAASTQPKLTKFPTYGVIHEPRDRFLANKEYFQNLLSYDGYLTISNNLEAFLKNLFYGIGRSARIGFYYNTCQKNIADPGFLERLQAGDVRLTYFGTNWDKRRTRFFKLLSERDDVNIHGPEHAWREINPRAYKGVLAFDGCSVQNQYKRNGIGLALLSDRHLADDIISNRIFEITSVGAIAISCRIPWLERNFGDSIYYFDQECTDRQLLEQISNILEKIKANPVDAATRARAAKQIFDGRFCAEKLLLNAIEYHRAVMAPDGIGPGEHAADRPLISVIVRCGRRPLEIIRRAMTSLVNQSFGRFHVILVRYSGLDVTSIISEFSHFVDEIEVADCVGGNRSNALWAGLRRIKGDYFSILDDDDELMPRHFESILALDRTAADRFFAYTGNIRVYRDPKPIMGGALERRFIHSFGISQCKNFFDQAQFFRSNCFVASAAMLDRDVLVDPQLTSAEDSYLILSLLAKCKAQFNFRATAVQHESEKSFDRVVDPGRANDMLTVYLRLVACYGQTPQVDDAHEVLRAQNEAIVFPKIYDIEEREYCIVYHVKDFHLSRVSKALMSALPFSLDTATLVVTPGSDLLDAARVAMSITPPCQPWHYAVQFGLVFQTAHDSSCLVEIHCRVIEGTIGFGVLNKREDDFLYRVGVSASPKPILVHLPIESVQAIGRFVVLNWDSRDEAHAEVSRVVLWSEVSPRRESEGSGVEPGGTHCPTETDG